MNVYFSILIFGGSMGLIMGYGIYSINRLKNGMLKRINNNICHKSLNLLWNIFLPIAFVSILIIPINLLRAYIEEPNLAEYLISAYIMSFIVSFFVLIIVFVKLGKIKVEYIAIKNHKFIKNARKQKYTLWLIRIGGISAASILIFTIYIKQKYSYILHNNPWLFLIPISSIFIIGIIIFWILFYRTRE